MKKLKISLLALSVMGLAACSSSPRSNQQVVDQISQFGVQYQVTDNQAADHGVNCAKLGADWASCNTATITLTNNGPALTSKNWAIYMSNVHETLRVDNDQFKMTHIVGDLTRLEPTEKFKGIAAGESIEIPIVNEYWQLFITDVMPRWYVTAANATPKIITSTDTENLSDFVKPFGDQWKRIADDKNVLMLPQSRFTKNADVAQLPASALRGQITPTPRSVKVHAADVDLSRGVALHLEVLANNQADAVKQRFDLMGLKLQSAGYAVHTRIAVNHFQGADAVSGAYELRITPRGTDIIGYDQAGVYYGLMSLLSLVPAEGKPIIATLEAKDAPRFAYRGAFLDVARNFHSKQAVLRMLDQMAAWKMNKFHFHLTDDEAWRIEIPGLPELTDVGSKRCHDLTEQQCLLPQLGSGPFTDNNGTGHFSRADYIEIVKYAQARNIEVIPEIDMPAHARAAVISMEARYQQLMKAGKPQQASEYRLVDPTDTSNTRSVQLYDRTSYLNPCLDSSKRFVDKVIGEVQAMHREAGQPLTTWHFGGDEAKNIRLGTGYSDVKNPKAGTGILDQSKEDKPWAKSQVCQAVVKSGKVEDLEHLPSHFALEVSKMVKAHGIPVMQAWQDGLKDATDAHAFATSRVRVNFWDTLYWGGFDTANDWTLKDYEVVISNPDYVYMDFPYEVNPNERGYYWGTRFSDERKMFGFAPDNLPQNAETSVDRDGKTFDATSNKPWSGAYGISVHLWSETTRTDQQMDYMVFPRLLSVAERGWHRAEWELDYQQGRTFKGGETHFVNQQQRNQDWQRFANLLGQRELGKMDKAGIHYRLPVPGARVENGTLTMNIALPGLPLEYSLDDGKRWQRYQPHAKPAITASDKVWVRSVSPDGKRFSRAEAL
ncbi:carbohydate-binding domain-containing protein [Pantoea sp. B9002]|uniref:beta-N-acetylhexosaminidase n=1 Tax=Pantoea sp. B9002 TaxID=2726979 RepID=UPI0015A215EC|nr:beta-N-acetylhexosaminidase [Pantoea sp. B9002]NWA62469.1 carbohydate-binding domain-containing protein [Pantoea sp. B9002]